MFKNLIKYYSRYSMDEYNKLKISNNIWKCFFGIIYVYEFLIELKSLVL